MGQITTYFQEIVEKQKQIGYFFPTLLRPPIELESLPDFEKKLGFRLNKELVELYSFSDGATLDHETPSGKTGLIPIHNFLSLSAAVSNYEMQKYQLGFEDQFTVWDTGYKPGDKLFPFLEDGGGNTYWVDLNTDSPNFEKIFWTNTYPSSPGYAFNSLTTMFKTIAQAYREDIFFLDEEGYLDEDYNRWDEIAKANNPGLPFWDKDIE